MPADVEELKKRFYRLYHLDARWAARAPGRVNLIGEHIDYNGGYVLPAAIDRDIVMLAAPSPDLNSAIYSIAYQEGFEWASDSPPPGPVAPRWANYFLAALDQLGAREMTAPPLRILVGGNVPAAAGLSSSAALLVCATTLALSIIGRRLTGREIALLSQSAEHGDRLRIRSGIMDQFISANAIAHHALKLDCGSLEFTPVPLDPNRMGILIIHSTVDRELTLSAYNQRRAECEQALKILNAASGQSRRFLAEYSSAELNSLKTDFPPIPERRARHVVTEQERVIQFERALVRSDLPAAGQLLNDSHESLRVDYEVSCEELDFIQKHANELEGVYGCRLTGAGFGGCSVALVAPEAASQVQAELVDRFEKGFNRRPWSLLTSACQGAGMIDLN